MTFEIILYFCRRGQENLREMKQDTFSIKTDGSGRRYVEQTVGEMDKNHKDTDAIDDTIGEGRMYATGSPFCPVASFEKYLSKLPKGPAAKKDLFLRPLDSFTHRTLSGITTRL